MELATGAVRYEFSGPGAAGWFAAFSADGSTFLASALFGSGAQRWSTAPTGQKGRTPPRPTNGFSAPKGHGMILSADVASTGHIALAMSDGSVHVKAPDGSTPALAPLPDKGHTRIAFAADGRSLAAVRHGKAYVWSLPKAAAPSAK